MGVLVFFLALVLAPLAKGDLPIHCRRKWVYGEWTLKKSAVTEGVNRCGYATPDSNEQHFSNKGVFEFSESGKEMTIALKKPNIVECLEGCEEGKNNGYFSLIYDEGMEIKLPGFNFFAFFHYRPKANTNIKMSDRLEDYDSECDKTRTGWFHTGGVMPKYWGCASMLQVKAVSPQNCSLRNDLKSMDPVVSPYGNFAYKSIHEEKPRFRLESSKAKAEFAKRACTTYEAQLLESAGIGSKQAEILRLDQNAKFTYDHEWIKAHNLDPNSLWEAVAYDHFEGISLDEAMKRLGGSKSKVIPSVSSHSRHHRSRTSNLVGTGVSGLPKEFDWRKKGISTPIQDQGNCGSCYAQAALDVAAMRWQIKNPDSPKKFFSVQDHMDNAFYNQGCQGGYPFLVGKHGHDIGFVEKECYDFGENKCTKRYYISSYGYVGGYYGGSTESSIMKEIHDNGPVIAAFEPTGQFFSYKSGVFTGPKGQHTDDWEKTDHAIVLVGWGEADGIKYWIGKNSWGERWGDHGYFKIRKGTDETGIESMAIHLEFSS
ncbi:hypothetical protein AAMO2058_000863500 [Amorphochlora amoebiformis]